MRFAAFLRLFALAVLLVPGSRFAAAGEAKDRILLADETLLEGKVLAVSSEGIHLFLDEGLRSLAWKEMDRGLCARLREQRLRRANVPSARALYELALDCRRWGLKAYAGRLLSRLAVAHPRLEKVVELWKREVPVEEKDLALAGGIDAFFQRQDRAAYEAFQKAAAAAPETVLADTAKKYLRVLLRAGFRVPRDEDDGPLDRTLKLQHKKIRDYVFFAQDQLRLAEGHSKGGSVTQMRNALKAAEQILNGAETTCEQIMIGELTPRAKQVFTDQRNRIRQERFEVHLKAGDYYLKRRLWTDAQRSIDNALAMRPEDAQAKALKERLLRAWGSSHR